MRLLVAGLLGAVLSSTTVAHSQRTGSRGAAAANPLVIYFVDVEGGQSTLIVTPAGQSLLVDTGFPGDGTFESKPGDPRAARDAGRILAAARDAGVRQIDYLLITHFHADHDGGVVELSQQIPIRTFVDHGTVSPEADRTVPGTLDAFKAYAAVRASGQHLEVKPGDHVPLNGVDVMIVSSAGGVLPRALAVAPRPNPSCGAVLPPREPYENPRSTGFRLLFGMFRFLDLGDLTGPPLFALACPSPLVGPFDVYLVAHHGGSDAADPATFGGFMPRVAVLNNGAQKGGDPQTFALLHQVRGLDDVWQLHRSVRAGEQNFADGHIANLDETTSHWIKLSAREDGSFSVTNGRTGSTTPYGTRR